MKCNCCGSKKTIKDNEGNIFCSNCGYYIQKNNEVLHAKSGLTSTDALEANLDILSENF